ncbi:MAG: hypothetical protein ACI8W8_002397 [Rhodothermales bacterium]|jgi:hypothetical protein
MTMNLRTIILRLLAYSVVAGTCFAQNTRPDTSMIGPQPDYAATELKAEPWPQFVHDALFAPATGINVVGTVAALLPAWPFEAPVSVTIADSAGNIVAEHHEISPLHGRHLVELRRAVAPGTYVVTLRIDPYNVVNEISETNNESVTKVEVTDSVPPAIDLQPIAERLELTSVEISASAKNEGVHDWLDATVSSALAAEGWYYDHVIRRPDASTANADLLVELLLQPGEHDEGIKLTIGALRELWFVDSVDVLDLLRPQAVAGTDIALFDNTVLGTAAVSPAIIAPEIITLAISLSPTDEARQYLQVSVPVVQDGRGPIPLIAKFPPDPVSVRFEAMTADGRAAIFDTVVRPGLPGEAIASGFLPKSTDGDLKGLITVDPKNAIAEYDEDNNAIEFTTEPPPPENDLSPHCDRATSRSVTVTTDPRNPVLLELVRRTGLQALGDNHAPLYLNVFPWDRALPGVLNFVRPDIKLDFDLLVVAPVLDIVARGSDDVRQALVETYGMQWYVEDAVALDSLPFWAELQTIDILPDYPVVIGIKLSAADIAVQYRRVSLPVEYSHGAIPLPAHRFDTSLPFFDNTTRYAAPIAVEFSYGTAREGAVRDYLTFEFGVRRATAFLLEAAADTPVNVFIDPFDILEERDESNNACEIRNVVDLPRGRLHAKAQIGNDGELHVAGSFFNPSDQAIVLHFSSGLQMDFTVNEQYRWSANKFFTQALTEVVVDPGASHQWSLTAPVDEIIAAVGPTDVWHIELELLGTDYHAATRVRPPSVEPPEPGPGPVLPPFPDDILDLIVGPDGLDFSLLGDALEIIKPPDGGNLFNDFQQNNSFHYTPGAHYGGVDYVTFRLGEGDNARDIMRRLKVGPQEHDLQLGVGWNLVSFPTRPFESASEIISRVPDGKAWDFRNGDYRELRKIAVGRGIWLYSGEAITLSYLGEPIGEPRVELAEGWNIMGAVNPDAIPDDPRILAIYAFDGAGFDDARELRTGEGYWLYASRPFTLPLK